MATVILKRRNYSLKVPHDLVAVKSLKTKWSFSRKEEMFSVTPTRILISGNFSRHIVIRWFQKVYEKLFPIKYTLEYLSEAEYSQMNVKKTGIK